MQRSVERASAVRAERETVESRIEASGMLEQDAIVYPSIHQDRPLSRSTAWR
jgi:hypothetical protein